MAPIISLSEDTRVTGDWRPSSNVNLSRSEWNINYKERKKENDW